MAAHSLRPTTILERPEGHLLKWVDEATGEAYWMPLECVHGSRPVQNFLAKFAGYVASGPDDPVLRRLVRELPTLPRVQGVSRLGWTPDHDGFVYGGHIYEAVPFSRPFEFIAPDGTLLRNAVDAFAPRGDAHAQREGFLTLWQQSTEFRLVLSLATMSPFLEIVGAPPIAFHVAGLTGLGKTTLLRLAVSAFENPDSPLTKVDFSKDTQNYADAQLGILHNFPLLLDETTLRGSDELETAAYHIATGRTKGRLTGPERQYLPAEPMTYSLVCFLSGEDVFRTQLTRGGGAARVFEIVLAGPVWPPDDLPHWYALAGQHSGWYGHDLMAWTLRELFVDEDMGGTPLLAGYHAYRARAAKTWPGSHGRTLDFLACVELGYRLAVRTLHVEWPLQDDVVRFVASVRGRLQRGAKADEVIAALGGTPGASEWSRRGFIPVGELERIGWELDLKRKPMQDMLLMCA